MPVWLPLLAAVAGQVPVPPIAVIESDDRPVWVDEERMERSYHDPFGSYYKGSSIVRRGDRLRVRVRTESLRFGLPNVIISRLVELDCPGRRYRILSSDARAWVPEDSHRRRMPNARFAPLARGEFSSLADRLCPAPVTSAGDE